ncbi:AAA family ATPase [Actinoplanes sp. Pm04-4]|uniref:AAA family ATPase n=1 Tax=Paractinoplanes pyxinae TaxID=2997416 RepID=A0ABT4ARF1_9ACTN|nr:AAA family ATPase [Actinoplanes pyxinae]MCY1136757.1 AAA family ATPase [Actinoplanes pyxinae]
MNDHRDPVDAPGLVGRGALWAELTGLLTGSPTGDAAAAVLLAGPAGIGKTALVERFVGAAEAAGHVVARTRGRAGMAASPFAALRELLDGSEAVAALPERQRDAVEAALGGAVEPTDLLTLRLGVAAAFEAPGGDRPLVLVVDDVDRIDAPSFDLLLTVTATIVWNQLPVVALFACRDNRLPAELADLVRVVTVPALTEQQAERLLDTVAGGGGRADRLRLLERAAGNPLALIELSRRGDAPAGPVRLFVTAIEALPDGARRALAYAAAGESRISVIAAADPGITARQWQDAAEAGLIEVLDGWVRFRHPLVEYAALLVAGDATERDLHRRLADVVPERYQALWHRASAAEGDDPALAAELTATADDPAADPPTALRLLELAAERVPVDERARVLLTASGRAAAIGRVTWAARLLENARTVAGPDPEPNLRADLLALSSWLETVRGRPVAGGELLRQAIGAGGDLRVPVLALVVVTAGFPSFLLGSPELDHSVLDGLGRLPEATGGITLMPQALVAPGPEVVEAVRATPDPVTADDVVRGVSVGGAAMLLDRPEDSLRLVRPGVQAVLEGTAGAVFLTAPGVAGWALIDRGRWAEAEQMIVPLLSSPAAAEATAIRTGAYAQLAVIAYARGRTAAAEDLLAQAGRQLDAYDIPAFAIRLRWARAGAAMAAGEYDWAYRLLRSAAAAEGVVHGWQVLVLPDLVSAAMRAGADATKDAARIVEQVGARGGWLTERRAARLAAARALLADEAPPVSNARALPGDEAPAVSSGGWPLEEGMLAVEVADRLRRAHQPGPARTTLLDALDAFDRIRAGAWIARAEADLRRRAPAGRTDVLAALTAQQEQIARLAAQGLTNKQIGERLFLSPRTIASHLYKIFPLLGLTNRAQLSDLVATADARE